MNDQIILPQHELVFALPFPLTFAFLWIAGTVRFWARRNLKDESMCLRVRDVGRSGWRLDESLDWGQEEMQSRILSTLFVLRPQASTYTLTESPKSMQEKHSAFKCRQSSVVTREWSKAWHNFTIAVLFHSTSLVSGKPWILSAQPREALSLLWLMRDLVNPLLCWEPIIPLRVEIAKTTGWKACRQCVYLSIEDVGRDWGWKSTHRWT